MDKKYCLEATDVNSFVSCSRDSYKNASKHIFVVQKDHISYFD